MKRKIKKWGNSLAVRIPKEIIEKHGLSENMSVEFRDQKGELVLSVSPKKTKLFHESWKEYLLPSVNKDTKNLSLEVDEILYGKSGR